MVGGKHTVVGNFVNIEPCWAHFFGFDDFAFIILGNIDFTLNIWVFWLYELTEDIIQDIFDKIAYYETRRI